jgi:hypothetical protein
LVAEKQVLEAKFGEALSLAQDLSREKDAVLAAQEERLKTAHEKAIAVLVKQHKATSQAAEMRREGEKRKLTARVRQLEQALINQGVTTSKDEGHVTHVSLRTTLQNIAQCLTSQVADRDTSPVSSPAPALHTTTVESELAEAESRMTRLEAKLAAAETTNDQLSASLATAQSQLSAAELATREIRESYLTLRGTVRTLIRIRGPAELVPGELYTLPDDQTLVIHKGSSGRLGNSRKGSSTSSVTSTATTPSPSSPLSLTSPASPSPAAWKFAADHIFPPDADISSIHNELLPFLDNAKDGADLLIMTYGRSGSGKTTTIDGLLRLVGEDLCSAGPRGTGLAGVHQLEEGIGLEVSITELYDNHLRSLTSRDSQPCPVPNKSHALFVPASVLGPSTRVHVSSPDALSSLLSVGACSRTTGATSLNRSSSRSAAVTTLFLPPPAETGVERASGGGGSITFVDLPGQESVTDAGDRADETAGINKGLFGLNSVFRIIAEQQRKKRPRAGSGAGAGLTPESVFGQSGEALPKLVGGLLFYGPRWDGVMGGTGGGAGDGGRRMRSKVVLVGTVSLMNDEQVNGTLETLRSLEVAREIRYCL